MKTKHAAVVALFVLSTACPSYTNAEVVTLVPEGGFPTGANINALAGPLLASDLDSVDIGGPGSFSAVASKDGNAATHSIGVELDYATGPAFFESTIGAPFSRTSILGHRASAESIFFFTVDTAAEYFIDGFFAVDDSAGTVVPGNVELELELLEFDMIGAGAPPPVTLFYNYQASKSTIDQAFFAGGLDGDEASVVEGEITGILDPSKFYRYRTLTTINAIDIDGDGALPPTDGTATATGMHSLVIASAVPEPSSLGILSLAASALFLQRRRSRVRRG
ncbi:MAG: PEP-CTERM sorting domain-containing protein [Planctomycetota bacterium]